MAIERPVFHPAQPAHSVPPEKAAHPLKPVAVGTSNPLAEKPPAEQSLGEQPAAITIDMRNVTVRRRGNAILRASWQVHDGERWVVLGPNGAGKTTLLKLAAAIEHPTSGTVKLLGEQLGKVDVGELRTRIGFASSALGELIPKRELVENVVLTAAYGVTSRWREKYQDVDNSRALGLLASLDVAGLAHREYGTLSTGEQKRVAIARALMPDPELLLLDEPSAGLDLSAREGLLQTLSKLAADPTAPVLVLVTHDVETIPVGFTHVLLMRDGQAVAHGPIAETLTISNIEKTFGMRFNITAFGGRYFARAI